MNKKIKNKNPKLEKQEDNNDDAILSDLDAQNNQTTNQSTII